MKMPILLSAWGALFLAISCAFAEPGKKNLGAIWFIGDSITQGNADGDPDGSPRKELYELLKQKGYDFTYTGHHVRSPEGLPVTGDSPEGNLYQYHSGHSGILIGEPGDQSGSSGSISKWWTQGRLQSVKPNTILIMLGTNDIGHGYKLEEAPQRLRGLLDNIYKQPNVGNPKVYLATIPPNRRKEHERTNVMIFNECIDRIVSDYNKRGKQLYAVDQFTPLDAEYAANMRGDNLHPSGQGNQTMAKTWLAAIEKSVGVESEQEEVVEAKFPGEKSLFKGYEMYTFKEENTRIQVVCPKKPAEGKPWLWRSLFWTALGKAHSADLKLVDEGYHVVLVHGDVSGHPRGNKNIDIAYQLLTTQYGFAPKMQMASYSRGTLSLFRWASANPEKVSSIYVDNGVTNVFSWPAGPHAEGNVSTSSGDKGSWEGFKRAFGFKSDAEALASKESPIDQLAPLAEHQVPILLVCGMNDHAVPYEENDAIVKERYEALGGHVEIITHNHGHSHGLKDPTEILAFIRKYTH